MVKTQAERGGRIEQDRRYYLSFSRLDAQDFAVAVRRLEASKIGSTGCSMSSSTMTSPACEPDQALKT